MKHRFKKWQYISYLNSKNKRIIGKIVSCNIFLPGGSSINIFATWGLTVESEPMYKVKLQNGHSVWKFESDGLILEKDTREEKFKRLINDCR